MTTNPLDIIANEIVADGHTAERMAATLIARTATAALTHDVIVANAVQALKYDGWEETHEGPRGVGTLTDEDLANIARTVLRSVGGA